MPGWQFIELWQLELEDDRQIQMHILKMLIAICNHVCRRTKWQELSNKNKQNYHFGKHEDFCFFFVVAKEESTTTQTYKLYLSLLSNQLS